MEALNAFLYLVQPIIGLAILALVCHVISNGIAMKKAHIKKKKEFKNMFKD